jgi:hypothetical protein
LEGKLKKIGATVKPFYQRKFSLKKKEKSREIPIMAPSNRIDYKQTPTHQIFLCFSHQRIPTIFFFHLNCQQIKFSSKKINFPQIQVKENRKNALGIFLSIFSELFIFNFPQIFYINWFELILFYALFMTGIYWIICQL